MGMASAPQVGSCGCPTPEAEPTEATKGRLGSVDDAKSPNTFAGLQAATVTAIVSTKTVCVHERTKSACMGAKTSRSTQMESWSSLQRTGVEAISMLVPLLLVMQSRHVAVEMEVRLAVGRGLPEEPRWRGLRHQVSLRGRRGRGLPSRRVSQRKSRRPPMTLTITTSETCVPNLRGLLARGWTNR